MKKIATTSLGDRRLISTWGNAELAHESAGHVTLIREAREVHGIGERSTCGQMPAGKPNSELNKIRVRRRTHLTVKTAQELEAADIGQSGKIRQRRGNLRRGLQPADRPQN